MSVYIVLVHHRQRNFKSNALIRCTVNEKRCERDTRVYDVTPFMTNTELLPSTTDRKI